jgi:AraC-like DNA-binding protein
MMNGSSGEAAPQGWHATGVERFATPFTSARANLEFWNHIASASSPGLTIESGEEEFRGELQRWRLPRVTLLWPRAVDSTIERRAEGGEERLLFHLQGLGHTEQVQGAKQCLLKSGDLSYCSTADGATLRTTKHDMLVVDVPRRLLDDKVPDLDRYMAARVPGYLPGVEALRKFLIATWKDGLAAGSEMDREWLTELDGVIVDLLALTIRGVGRYSEARPVPLEQVSRIIAARLDDPDLSGRDIALELGVTVRTLQLWLAATGKTPSSCILEARLAKATERLIGSRIESVTTIAHDLGFRDSAYFTRCFTRRFGMAPTCWQKMMRGDEPRNFKSDRYGGSD